MDRIIKEFERDCKVRGMTERSINSYRTCLNAYRDYLAAREKSFLTANKDDLVSFIESLRLDKELSIMTVKRYLAALSSLCEYLVFKELIQANYVRPVRSRYIRSYKETPEERKLISVEEMAHLINCTMDLRDKAVIALLAKSGVRRNELVTLDISDVDLIENKIRLKPTAKRTNRTVFFDDEAAYLLRRWLNVRESMNKKGCNALFLNHEGERLNRSGVFNAVVEAAMRVGLHDPTSERLEDHFGPHCCRHWFCTHLFRAGMRREFIKELRGDSRKEAFDLYNHIDLKELKEAYVACIPQLGV
jgi:integrase/recombinase XerD